MTHVPFTLITRETTRPPVLERQGEERHVRFEADEAHDHRKVAKSRKSRSSAAKLQCRTWVLPLTASASLPICRYSRSLQTDAP